MKQRKPFQFTATSDVITGVAGTAATDILTKAAHGLVTGMPFIPTFASGFDGLMSGNRYYAIKIDADTFKPALTPALAAAGTAEDFTVNGTDMTVAKPTPMRPSARFCSSALLLPQVETNQFTAYIGGRGSAGCPDPRTPIPLANSPFPSLEPYDFSDLYVLAASGDGIDVFGYQ